LLHIVALVSNAQKPDMADWSRIKQCKRRWIITGIPSGTTIDHTLTASQ
jgi:hypothetical protein